MKNLFLMGLMFTALFSASCGKEDDEVTVPQGRGEYKIICIRQGLMNYGYQYGKYTNEARLYPIYTYYSTWYRVPAVCYNW